MTAVHVPSFWSRLAHPLAVGCLVAACGGGDLSLPGSGDVVIRVVEGDGQRGSVGEPLAAPVVVEVTDEGGDPVEGATVEFALTSAGEGAGITPATALTGADGRAEAHVQLGDKVGVQTGEARVAGAGDTAPTTTFSALAESADNRSPTADFTWSCEQLTCQLTDASTDSDGSLTAWTWRFGDGSTSAEREPSHTYAASGTYTVRLTVTDDEGATDESSDDVTVTAPSEPPLNQPPQAQFDISCQDLRCTFVDRSSDGDGSVVSWQWSFGDGGTSTQRNPTHDYAAGGHYEVLLMVTDDDGAADTRTHAADPQANREPDADFDVRCEELTCTFTDKSQDEDGVIVSRQWNFGDGSTSGEPDPVHTYGEEGRYEVVLTVTDDDGATDAKNRRVDPKE